MSELPNNMNDDRLAELLIGCRQYDRMCQKGVYDRFYQYTFSVALRYAANQYEAREIVNDVFFQVFTKIERYDPDQPFQPWLHTITVRAGIDYYRKYHQHKVALINTEEMPEGIEHENISGQLNAEAISNLIQQLPPAYRMAINLYAIEGYEHHEIAKIMGISEGTSKSNLFKARLKLKNMLSKQNSTEKINRS